MKIQSRFNFLSPCTFKSLRNFTILLSCFHMWASAAYGNGDPEAGKQLFQSCAKCHGALGEGKGADAAWAARGPKLAGQHAWYLRESITKYKNGLRAYESSDRTGEVMKGMAMTLILSKEENVEHIIAYLTNLN
ncbi:MAG: cytochrome c [Oligoflexales bacterium]